MNKIIAVFLVALCMTVCVTAYSDGVQADLQDNLIRLHIIADSDDDNDQAVKLKVRDAILKNVGDRLSSPSPLNEFNPKREASSLTKMSLTPSSLAKAGSSTKRVTEYPGSV